PQNPLTPYTPLFRSPGTPRTDVLQDVFTESAQAPSAVAVRPTVVPAPATTVTQTSRLEFGSMVPRFQVTTAPAAVPPSVARTNVPLFSVARITVFADGASPVLRIVRHMSKLRPKIARSGVSQDSSSTGLTTRTEACASAVTPWAVRTEAVFWKLPVWAARALNENSRLSPAGSVPTL